MNYQIDLTKPPIGPPNRTMKDTIFFGLKETKESIAKTLFWRIYIDKYMKELRIKKNKEK